MSDLLLDTHIALWLNNGDVRLGKAAQQTIEATWKAGGRNPSERSQRMGNRDARGQGFH